MPESLKLVKPLPVEVVPSGEPIDLAAWADRYARVVLELAQRTAAKQAA